MYYYSKWDKSTINAKKLKIEGNTLSWTEKCKEDTDFLQASLISDHCLNWTFTIHQTPKMDALIKLHESVIGIVRVDCKQPIYCGFAFLTGYAMIENIQKEIMERQ